MKTDHQTVLEMALSLIQNEMAGGPLPRELIDKAVDDVFAMDHVRSEPRGWAESVDREAVIRELQTRLSIWIGRERILEADDERHEAWLNAERKEGWRWWPRYRRWMEQDWSTTAVESLESVTDRIVGLLEDPHRKGPWDRRGLVVGHVQSGKTANYTGVICKAADAGYKIIVVLAGMHKNLRSQTQMRLDEGFLGYETKPVAEARGRELRTIGVGQIDSDPDIRPNYVTNRSDSGDFKRSVANSLGITPDSRPWLFVVKKNKSVLNNLLNWVEERVANAHEEGTNRPIVSELPLLVIDDEADNASVDTGDQPLDADGKFDQDYEPKAINRAIRRLLYVFDKSAYLGYTATPFANIFIHEQAGTREYGEDVFPRSFIVNLPAPSNYCGPARIFGLDQGVADDAYVSLSGSLVKHVTDHADSLALNERSGWMPPVHRNGHQPLCNGVSEIPDSLKEAILAFILACAARRVRGQRSQHNSMLVHVTRFTNVQAQVRMQIEEYLNSVKRRLIRGEGGANVRVTDTLRTLWEDDFVPVTSTVQHEVDDDQITAIGWDEVEREIRLAAEDIVIREINGSAKDVLDYEDHSGTGLNVIAVGGEKLARGLTLEGLTVSYFLRSTRMYDTLMQMGRWFGYRPGYLDLCRLYTTADLEDWFHHITEASEELRQEFDHMAAVGGTPRQYGLKVQSHPVLMVTSRVKMRNAFQLQLSFAGSLQETVVLHRNTERLRSNLRATEVLIQNLNVDAKRNPRRDRPEGGRHRWEGSILWEGVNSDCIVDFLSSFRSHEDAVKVNCEMLADFVRRQVAIGELTSWTVVLLAGDGGHGTAEIAGITVDQIYRATNERTFTLSEQKENGSYRIRRLLAPRDEAIDLRMDQYQAALDLAIREYTEDPARSRRNTAPTVPSGPSIRAVRGLGDPESGVEAHPERGLLLLYPLSPDGGEIEFDGPIVGFGVSFPTSRRAAKVTYAVNNIFWSQEYGADL